MLRPIVAEDRRRRRRRPALDRRQPVCAPNSGLQRNRRRCSATGRWIRCASSARPVARNCGTSSPRPAELARERAERRHREHAAAARLRLVHRAIARLQQLLQLDAVLGEERDADARRCRAGGVRRSGSARARWRAGGRRPTWRRRRRCRAAAARTRRRRCAPADRGRACSAACARRTRRAADRRLRGRACR